MKPSERIGFRNKIESDLETVEGEVTRLFSQRRVFQSLAQAFQGNTTLNAEWTQLHTFIFSGYTAQASMRLRRLMDCSPPEDTVSLANIVSRLCEHPDIITRKEYVARFTTNVGVRTAGSNDQETAARLKQVVVAHRDSEANALFDQFAEPCDPCLNPVKLCPVFLAAQRKWEKVHTYVDKRLAHLDRNAPANPTWRDLDEAIDAVGDLYCKVSLLVTGIAQTLEDLPGTWQGADWRPLLEVPWVTRCQQN